MLPYLHMTTGEKSWHVSKLQAGNIISSYYHNPNVNSFPNSLTMRNKTMRNNTPVKLVMSASVFAPYTSTSGGYLYTITQSLEGYLYESEVWIIS